MQSAPTGRTIFKKALFLTLGLLLLIPAAANAEAYSICETGANSDSTGNYTYGSNKCCDTADLDKGLLTYDANYVNWFNTTHPAQSLPIGHAYTVNKTVSYTDYSSQLTSAGIYPDYYVQGACVEYMMADFCQDIIGYSNCYYLAGDKDYISVDPEAFHNHVRYRGPVCWCHLKRKSDGKDGRWITRQYASAASDDFCFEGCIDACAELAGVNSSDSSATPNINARLEMLRGF
jgi:hypothetical protein